MRASSHHPFAGTLRCHCARFAFLGHREGNADRAANRRSSRGSHISGQAQQYGAPPPHSSAAKVCCRSQTGSCARSVPASLASREATASRYSERMVLLAFECAGARHHYHKWRLSGRRLAAMTVACSDASVGNVAQATGRTGALLCAAIATRIAWSMAWRQWRGGQMRIWVRGGALERVGPPSPRRRAPVSRPPRCYTFATQSLRNGPYSGVRDAHAHG